MRNKVVFANHLRGISALLVMAVHFGCVYFESNGFISSRLGNSPDLSSSNMTFIWLCNNVINLGVVGVAIFFLISGFVIDYSLKKMKPSTFLVQRFFRIYPTFLFSTLICLAIIALNFNFNLNAAPAYLNIKTVMSNLLLVNQSFGIPDINFVSWSLAVEVKFYLLMAFSYRASQKRNVSVAIIISTLLCMFYLCINNYGNGAGFIERFMSDFKYLPFMLIGLCLNRLMNQELSKNGTLLAATYLLMLFLSVEILTDNPKITAIIAMNYSYAFLIFMALFLLRNKIMDNFILDFLSRISYPLYLVHSVCGYVIISAMKEKGFGILLSYAFAISFSMVLAYIMHISVEIKSNKVGKRITCPPTPQQSIQL